MREQFLIWALGALFVFVGAVAGLMVKIALTMFDWRREIDANIAGNTERIAKLDQWKEDHHLEALRTRDELRIQREKIMALSAEKKED